MQMPMKNRNVSLATAAFISTLYCSTRSGRRAERITAFELS
jgi:hypothetical protein